MMEKSSSTTRPVTIGICTSASKANIKALIAKISSLTNVTVRFIELPYNDLDSFWLSSKGLDGVIICHSINNRRFAITDVMDALYDKFLSNVKQEFGEDNVCVIAHDFEWPMGPATSTPKGHTKVKESHMESFRSKQPTTFKCSKLAMVCGGMDKQVDMDEEDWTKLENFVRHCRVRSGGFGFVVEIHGFKIDLKDSRFLGGLVFLVVVAFFMKPYAKRFLYGSLEVVACYAVLFLLIPFTCRVYHSRGKGPQVFRNDTYWKIILASSILPKIYVVVRLYRAGGYVAFLLPVVPFIGLVYQRRRQSAKRQMIKGFSKQGDFQWSRPPWWKFPYRFWLHFINISVTYVKNLF